MKPNGFKELKVFKQISIKDHMTLGTKLSSEAFWFHSCKALTFTLPKILFRN